MKVGPEVPSVKRIIIGVLIIFGIGIAGAILG